MDYDNDGYLDVFFANGGKTNALYRNLDGTGFTNVSAGAGVNYKASFTLHSAWGDFDNDGWQDLFVANNGNDFLFHNNADGTFTRILP